MTHYRVYGLAVESELPLPELPKVDGPGPFCRVSVVSAPRATPPTWLHEWHLPSGEAWLSIGRLDSDYLLRFPSLADFLVSPDGGRVGCAAAPDVPYDTVRHLLLDQVLPLVVSLRGGLALHASAVADDGGAIAFMGSTGQGKSTLAACFAREGLRVLADDCLVVEETEAGLVGVPAYPGLRLWPHVIPELFGEAPELSEVAHYSDKKRLDAALGGLGYCREPVPIRRVFVLAPDEAPGGAPARVVPLPPRDAFMALLTHAYRLDVTDRSRLHGEFDRLGRAADAPFFYRLEFSRDLSRLPAIRTVILEHLTEAE
jgi:hypothetical protein